MMFLRLSINNDYNYGMGGVDIADQLPKGSGGGQSSFGQLGSCLLIVMSPTRNSWSPKK